MSSTSRIVWLMRCSCPAGNGWPGSVTSMRSWASESRERLALQLRLALLHELLELLADEVAALADQRALLGGQGGDRAQELGERALAPEDLDARLLERGQVGGAQDGVAAGVVDGREAGGSLLQLLQVGVVHGHPSCAAGERRDGSSGAPAGRRENS